MIKQVLLIILLSLAAIFFRTQLAHGLSAIVYAHNYLDKSLQTVFSEGHVGRLIQEMISLLTLPILGGVILALLFWVVKRSAMPHVMAIVWALWLVLIVSMGTQSASVAPAAVAQQTTRDKAVAVSEQNPVKN